MIQNFCRAASLSPAVMMRVSVLLVLSTSAAALETVVSADPEDPVLAAALAVLGPGWQLLPHTTHCQQAEPRQERYTHKILTLVGGYLWLVGWLAVWADCPLQTGPAVPGADPAGGRVCGQAGQGPDRGAVSAEPLPG